MTSDLPFYYECPWCGNRWYQEAEEPKRCEVCKHYLWEGTHEMHMQFEDITAWEKYNSSQEKEEPPQETAFNRLKRVFPDYF